MKKRLPTFVALAALLLAATAGLAAAEESTVGRAEEEPVALGVGTTSRAGEEAQDSSIVRAFHEAWERADDLEDAGWSQENLGDGPDDPYRLVHRQEDSPFEPPKATPIPTESGGHAVTIMNDDATYPSGVDARLASPTLDLRHVRGASASVAEPYRDDQVGGVLSDLHDAYLERFGSNSNTRPFHYLLVTPPSGWLPTPCLLTDIAFDACDTFGSAPGVPGEGREAYEGGEERVTRDTPPVQSPGGGFTILPSQRVVDEDVPIPGTREYGLYTDKDGRVYAPNPVDQREGLTYINVTFWHKWDLSANDGAYLEVREKLGDGTWSEWRHLEPADTWNQPATDPSSRYHEATTDERTVAYNGYLGDKRAFVGSRDDLVASTFNLNRFAGTEIQLGWRLTSQSNFVDDLGWFIDDVVLWTNTHDRDVGVRDIERPDEGDRVAVDDPFHPSATVRNYGNQEMHDVQVTFEVTPQADEDEVLWRDTQVLDEIEPQREVVVDATEAFDPPETGSYRLVTSLTPREVPDDASEDNLTHSPETAPNDDNDEASIPFQVQTKPRVDVSVTVDDETDQTDVGTPKRFTVSMENTGNLPLSGPVTVTATRLERGSLDPTDDRQVIDRVQVQPGEFPFGQDLNTFGSEDNNWAQAFQWDDGLRTPGIYRLEATFDTDQGRFSGSTTTFVRATPPAYYDEDADALLENPFSRDSTYSLGMETTAYTAEQLGSDPIEVRATPLLPDPVSPTHVWYGRGDDGDVGTATHGESAERTAGANETLNLGSTYDRTEFDSYDRTRDSNMVDHYWLTREVNLTAHDDADAVYLSYWHTGEFNWTGRSTSDQRDPDRARGHVEILPERNAFLTDPADGQLGDDQDLPSAETGEPLVDRRTPETDRDVRVVSGEAVYAQSVATYESPVPWTKETLDLTPWKGEHVTLRFHLETTSERDKVNSSEAGSLSPWLVDQVAVNALDDGRNETVFEADLEGDDWSRWSTEDGFQLRDPRSPVALHEGRGWDRYNYGGDSLPSGWHITRTRDRPEAGTLENSPMLRWGDPQDRDELPSDVAFSVLRSPGFSLEGAREPGLSFLQNYTLPSDRQAYPHAFPAQIQDGSPYVTSGASVWIVGEDEEGNEVVRELLEPTRRSEAFYDAPIANYYSGTNETCLPRGSNGFPGADELHCTTALREYPDAPNVFTGRSGREAGEPGTSRWERARFDLSPYATPENRSLTYHLEFHAINQRTDDVESFGWLVDDVRVTEQTFANDMAVDEIIRPGDRNAVGPGLDIPIALRLQNRGLYDQVGVEATYLVRNATGDVVYGPVTQKTDPGIAIPGARNTENPDKNRSLVFKTPWKTPQEEGRYVIEGRVDLSDALSGHAFPDDNNANDVLRKEIQVDARRSVGIQPARVQPDEDVVDPFVGTTDSFRTFTVQVENKGTLPEVFTGDDAGDFAVNLTIRNGAGKVVFESATPIRKLAPGEVRDVQFRNAWRPAGTGVYEVNFTLQHPNETVSRESADDVRTLTYTVFEEFLPRPDENLRSMLGSDDAGWRFEDGAWHFGRGETYRAGADDALRLEEPVTLRAISRGLIRVNHTYDFETGYDGGLLEVKPVDGDTWYPVPPRPIDEGYPVDMSQASPLVDEPTDDVAALSGTSGGGEEPRPVETGFDLGGVEPLLDRSTIMEDPLEEGLGETASSRLGDWTTDYLSRVQPHSGDVMFHSNHSTVERRCWKTWSENNGGNECATDEDRNAPEDAPYDGRKYLNITFDEEYPEDETPLSQRLARSDAEALRVTFWDYRVIGSTNVQPHGTQEGTPQEISVDLVCVSEICPKEDTVTLDPVKRDGYDDNYRSWTKNVYTVPTSALTGFLGPDRDLRLSFVHHLLSGPTNSPSLWSTDSRSIHAGWFVDDVALGIVDGDGRVTPYWSDDLEDYNRTYEVPGSYPHNSLDEGTNPGQRCFEGDPDVENDGGERENYNCRQEILNVGPWDGDGFFHQAGTSIANYYDRLLWDPIEAWGGEALCTVETANGTEERPCDTLPDDVRQDAPKRHGLWRHVEAGDLPCGPLADKEAELAEENVYPDNYTAKDDQFRACGPTRNDRERAGGARLVTDLNLRPAVDDVTLTFDHEHRFRNDELPQGQAGQSGVEGRSAGRLEVSVDGGDTWIPLEPVSREVKHVPLYAIGGEETTASHTTLGGREGDPEGNSIYGMEGAGFTGVSGFDVDDGAEVDTATYDLSRFAGRDVKVAWHAFFGTHNNSQAATDIGYEYWSIRNVSVSADVLDGERLDMRFQASTDGSQQAGGWTIHDLTMAGVDSDVNVGGTIEGLPGDEPLPSGDNDFSVVLENKGEQAVRANVTLTLRDGHSGEVLDAWKEGSVRLPTEVKAERTTLGGDDLVVNLDPETDYVMDLEVQVVDDDQRLAEAIRADNTDSVRLDAEDIQRGSDLVVSDVHTSPNNLPGDSEERVRVEATVLNEGFASRPRLRHLNLTVTPGDGGEPVLTRSGEDALQRNPGFRFQEPYQEKTYAWEIPPEDVASLPDTLLDVGVKAVQDSSGEVDTEQDVAYVGPGFFQDLAYKQPVRNETLQRHDTCRFEPAPGDTSSVTWQNRQRNHSEYRSFGAGPVRLSGGGADQGNPQQGDQQNQQDQVGATGSLVCSISNLDDLGDTVRLNFYTAYKFEDPSGANGYRVLWGTSEAGTECDPTNTIDTLVSGGMPSTPRFRKGGWVQESTKIPADLLGDAEQGCVGFEVDVGQSSAMQGVFVDDIVVAPYQVKIAPEESVNHVQDDMVKKYPFTVTNSGAFNDTYRFAFVDDNGDPADVPRSWDLEVQTLDGETVEEVALDAGETRTFQLAVTIPVQGAGSTSGKTSAAVSAISVTDGLIRDTATFDFEFDYPPRPNLDVIDASVNNPGLAAGRPRSVTVTVANVGAETATDVPVAVTDTMPPRFGEPPRNLTQVDGDPLPNITLEPGQTTTVIAGWTPDRAGPHNLTVHVDPGETVVESDAEDNVEVLEVPVGAAQFPDLEVDLQVDDTDPQAGSTVPVNATVTNEGQAPAQGVRVNLRVGVSDLLDGRPPHILDQVIEPGETVHLDTTWPASFPGEYQAFLKAFPLSGTLEPADTQDDNLDVVPLTVRSQGLRLVGPEDPVPADQGDEVTTQVSIQNRGEQNETVDLRAEAAGDLRGRLTSDGVSVTQATIHRGETLNLTLETRTPSQAVAGTYPVDVTIVSRETGQRESLTVPVEVGPDPGLAVEASAVDVDPGGGTLPLEVRNTGNVRTTVDVAATDLPAGWTLEVDPVELEPFASRQAEAHLDVPTNASAGVQDIGVTVTDGNTSDAAPVRVDVADRGVLDLTLAPDDVAVRPGSTVTFEATVASVGNVPAFADLHVDAPDTWDVDLSRPRARVPDGDVIETTFTVDIPSEAPRGTSEIALKAVGQDETFLGNATVRVGVPDATATNVDQNPRVNVEDGQDVSFAVDLRNTGNLDLDETGVGLYVDDDLVDFATATDVPGGGKDEVTLNWTAEAGEHVILVVADPGEKIQEDDEGNNARLLVVQVGGDAQVFGDVERAVPVPPVLAIVGLLAAALGRRWTP